VLLVLMPFMLTAQSEKSEPPKDTVRAPKSDSLRVRVYPRAIRFGTDVISLVKNQVGGSFSGWEANADIDLGRYYLAADYGHWGRTEDLKTGGLYMNDGTYWRVGVDANLLMKDPDRNMVFLGFRYGRSMYSESSSVTTSDPFFKTTTTQFTNPAVTAGWGELTGGIRVKIWKEFWMGYTARMKFGAGVHGETQMKTYEIPGYGVKSTGLTWGFNYQIFWRIPFTKTKPRKASPVPVKNPD
jgi:hypothetical protein